MQTDLKVNAKCTDGHKQTHEHTLFPGVKVREENCIWLGKKTSNLFVFISNSIFEIRDLRQKFSE